METNYDIERTKLLSESKIESTKKYQFKVNYMKCGIGLIIGTVVGIVMYLMLNLEFSVISTNFIPTAPVHQVTTFQRSGSGVFNSAAVAADAANCSTIGKNILLSGGSAVDSAIASMLCVGLLSSQSCGIGGGFFMIVYQAKTEEAVFINAREIAAGKAYRDMFRGNSELSQLGSMAVAVPGAIAGYWEAHQRYGKLPWKELFAPAIKLAENGYPCPRALAEAISEKADFVRNRSLNLWPIFENKDGSLKKEGDVIRLPLLAKTLRKISLDGADVFYRGSLAQDIVFDLHHGFGESIITQEDLSSYRSVVQPALNITIDNRVVFTPGPPGSGSVLSLILNILHGYGFNPQSLSEKNKVLTYHRIVETFRFAYAKRSALGDDKFNKTIDEIVKNMTSDWYADSLRSMIDDNRTHPVKYYGPDFVLPKDSGTSHLSVYAPNGDAVAITSTINTYFGSKVRGARTGVIFNNEMDDFSSPNITNAYGVPPSPSNFIFPGKRPMSSMTPTIVVETDPQTSRRKVRMIDGAAGGTRITTSTATTLLNCLWFGENVTSSVGKKRIHDQLMPNHTSFEHGFDQEVIEGLAAKGHKYVIESAGSVVQAILVRDDGKISAACDPRKGGAPDGF